MQDPHPLGLPVQPREHQREDDLRGVDLPGDGQQQLAERNGKPRGEQEKRADEPHVDPAGGIPEPEACDHQDHRHGDPEDQVEGQQRVWVEMIEPLHRGDIVRLSVEPLELLRTRADSYGREGEHPLG